MIQKSESTSRGGCPRCGKTIPFSKTMLRRGSRFTCARCGSALLVPKTATSLAAAALVLLLLLSRKLPFWIVGVMLVGAMLLEWLLAKVQLAIPGGAANPPPK
jgi:uncharacterized paraquat-inducible protein A